MKALQKEWYKKLKDDGFKDIEQFKEEGGKLVPCGWVAQKFTDGSELRRAQGLFAETLTGTYRKLWEARSLGMTRGEIATELGLTPRQVKYLVECTMKSFKAFVKSSRA